MRAPRSIRVLVGARNGELRAGICLSHQTLQGKVDRDHVFDYRRAQAHSGQCSCFQEGKLGRIWYERSRPYGSENPTARGLSKDLSKQIVGSAKAWPQVLEDKVEILTVRGSACKG